MPKAEPPNTKELQRLSWRALGLFQRATVQGPFIINHKRKDEILAALRYGQVNELPTQYRILGRGEGAEATVAVWLPGQEETTDKLTAEWVRRRQKGGGRFPAAAESRKPWLCSDCGHGWWWHVTDTERHGLKAGLCAHCGRTCKPRPMAKLLRKLRTETKLPGGKV